MIVAITKAEKEERQKRYTTRKATLGYDTNKFLKTNIRIRDERNHQVQYERLEIAPPATGRHRFTHCQTLYRDVHKFHSQRMWALANDTPQVSGVTWIELFAMFDTGGYRSTAGCHVKCEKINPEQKPEEARRKEVKEKGETETRRPSRACMERWRGSNRSAVKSSSTMSSRSKHRGSGWRKRKELRRLGKLGVTGNQPAIAAFVAMTTEERKRITRSIMMLKVGNNTKDMKQYDEHVARMEDTQRSEERPVQEADWLTRTEETILVKINRIAMGTVVRWTRKVTKSEQGDEHDRRKNDVQEEKQKYTSRLLACTRCGTQQETRGKQLRTDEGYRAMHCRACGRQERTAHNLCTCGIIWHQCVTHRVDPPVHTSRKNMIEKVADKGEDQRGKTAEQQKKGTGDSGQQSQRSRQSQRQEGSSRGSKCQLDRARPVQGKHGEAEAGYHRPPAAKDRQREASMPRSWMQKRAWTHSTEMEVSMPGSPSRLTRARTKEFAHAKLSSAISSSWLPPKSTTR